MTTQASLFPSAEDTVCAEVVEVLHALERSHGMPKSDARVTGVSLGMRIMTVFCRVNGRMYGATGVATPGEAARVVFEAMHGGLR